MLTEERLRDLRREANSGIRHGDRYLYLSPSVLAELVDEITRLKSGKFTPEELQSLCHGLSEDDYKAFCDGCDAYQRQLFGKCRSEDNTINNVFREWVVEEREACAQIAAGFLPNRVIGGCIAQAIRKRGNTPAEEKKT